MTLERTGDLGNLLKVLKPRDEFDADAIREWNIANYLLDDPYSLMAPPFENPVERVNQILAQKNLKLNLTHGTTTLGFKYRGGIILAADSRATNDKFVVSQDMHKILEVDKYILSTVAGGAADCFYWNRVLMRECRLYNIQEGKPMPVTRASCIMSNLAYRLKGMGVSMGMMIAGYDPEGARLYYVDSEAVRVEGNLFAIGSGETFALGVLDTDYKWELTDEEAYKLARRSIYHAAFLDAYSGGNIRIYHITPSGWKLVSINDYMEIHESYVEEQKAELGTAEGGDKSSYSQILHLKYL